MVKKKIAPTGMIPQLISEDNLYKELSLLIEKSKKKAVSQIKSTVNLLFWHVGKKINDEILHKKRAEYGAQVVTNLAEKLSAKYGRNFTLRNLRRMMQFAEDFPDKKIVSTLSTQLNCLSMDKDGIMVAEYWTELPPKKELEEKIKNSFS